KLGPETKFPRWLPFEKVLFNRPRILSKNFNENSFIDERFCEAFAIKCDATLGKFICPHRNRRHEITHQSLNRVRRDAPDAEESKDVSDSERIEVAAHLLEALLPPAESVRFHPLPVVSWEAPVLPLVSKRVRRRAGLHAQIEQLPVLPRVRAVTRNAYRNVSF